MIDSHIHILPNIDDGAANPSIATEMAQIAHNDGIHSIICTPHDLNYVYSNSRASILKAVDELQQILIEAKIDMALYPGAELHIDSNLVDKVLDGEAITLADKNKHVLVEFPKHLVPYGAETILENLLYNNLTPIIAHPERNPVLASRPDILTEWVNWGCKTQLTAMSVTGQFKDKLKSLSKQWCQQGLVHIIASDAHRPTGRSPILSRAYATVADWFGADAADTLIKTNPNNIIEGIELEDIKINESDIQNKKTNRRLFSIFSRKPRNRPSVNQ